MEHTVEVSLASLILAFNVLLAYPDATYVNLGLFKQNKAQKSIICYTLGQELRTVAAVSHHKSISLSLFLLLTASNGQ